MPGMDRMSSLFDRHWKDAFITAPEFHPSAKKAQDAPFVVALPARQGDESPEVYLRRIQTGNSWSAITAALSTYADPFSADVLQLHMRNFHFECYTTDLSLLRFFMEVGFAQGITAIAIDRILQGFETYYRSNYGFWVKSCYSFAFSLLVLHMTTFPRETTKIAGGLTYEVAHEMNAADYLRRAGGQGVSDYVLLLLYKNLTCAPFQSIKDTRSNGLFEDGELSIHGRFGVPSTLRVDDKALRTMGRELKTTQEFSDGYSYRNSASRSSVAGTYSIVEKHDLVRGEATLIPYVRGDKVLKEGMLRLGDPRSGEPRGTQAMVTLKGGYLFVKLDADLPAGTRSLLGYEDKSSIYLCKAVAVQNNYGFSYHDFIVADDDGQQHEFEAGDDDDFADWMAKINYVAAFLTHIDPYGEREGPRPHRRLISSAIDAAATSLSEISAKEDLLYETSYWFQALIPLQLPIRDHMLAAAERLCGEQRGAYLEKCMIECHMYILLEYLQCRKETSANEDGATEEGTTEKGKAEEGTTEEGSTEHRSTGGWSYGDPFGMNHRV
ncbi:hypothetical protein PG994_005193 [Apiospora phragmitis]|uniref:PH domain-containing protein n=1 Tax=Apiospora phragmitis TaxID=2905665 RepID=A0ABR1VSR2_9PEZI